MKIIGFAFVALSVVAGTAIPAPAKAHAWYPHECCHDKDCAPVESMAPIVPAGGGAPQVVVASKHGKAILRRSASIRESKDSRMHVCMGRYDTGDMEVICLFLPPGA